eukprot:NODE_99_length_20944_cov_0.552746.p1 type:complete len:912 gc:universal NODE_99_length_20944_cov_0.552746:14671-17406(+)
MPKKNIDQKQHEIDITKSPYQLDVKTLGDLIDPKNPVLLKELGGIDGILEKLKVDKSTGLVESNEKEKVADEVDHYGPYNSLLRAESKSRCFDKRRLWFGDNVVPSPQGKSLLSIIIGAFSDRMLQLLMVIATVSTIIGVLLQYHVIPSATNHDGAWAEGVAIFIAVIVVVSVGSLNDYQKETQFRKLSAKKEDRDIKVLRDGASKMVSAKDVVVGDIVEVEPGDLILVDGVFISGYNLKCDESSATGESDLIKKGLDHDMIMISGAKVAEGVGKYLVTNVGINSFHGKMMVGLIVDDKPTPLEEKLLKLTEIIAKLGVAAGIILFLALLMKLLITQALGDKFSDPTEVGIEFIDIFTETITIIVVAVPEGLPLAVTLALAYAGKRMIKDNNFVRIISACEVMGHATTICSDKTGTLTQNKMTVVSGTFGITVSWETQADDGVNKLIDSNLWSALMENIAINSSAFEEVDSETGKLAFVGSKTETALLGWQNKFGVNANDLRKSSTVAALYPFSSERKSMSVILKKNNSDGSFFYRLLTKGASEIVFKQCQFIANNAGDPVRVTPEESQVVNDIINKYAEGALRTIALSYKDLSQHEFEALTQLDDPPTSNMTLLGVVGIEDPLRVGVLEAVKKCQRAGVIVRMVTGDNIVTAKAIASKCGIYIKGGTVMEGFKFRKLSDSEMDKVVPKLQVLARSSPLDKQLLVEKLKKLGEVVAVTGDGTNDGAALKAADVGFSMGISGTEVAKEASSIILMDDNFASIVKALMWGRTVNEAVKKFLQFQLTVNVTAVLVTFITGIAGVTPALTAIQLLWINLIMDSFAALALATENPSPDILDKYPELKTAPLISFNMWKMIIFQSIFQIVISCTLSFSGPMLLIGKPQQEMTKEDQYLLNGIVFNTFVWLQLFNEIK